MQFKVKLNNAMHERGMTQADLSRITGIGKPSISQYCHGTNKPTLARRRTIAEALGMHPEYFEEVTPEPEEKPELTVATAARLMGKSKRFLELGLQQGTCPFGYAVKMDRWCYYISPHLFKQYTGIEV